MVIIIRKGIFNKSLMIIMKKYRRVCIVILWKLVVWCVLLAITVGLSVTFGPVGFIIGLLMCWAQSASFRRREQNKQHRELVSALKGKKG